MSTAAESTTGSTNPLQDLEDALAEWQTKAETLKAQADAAAAKTLALSEWVPKLESTVDDYKKVRHDRQKDVDDVDKRLDKLAQTIECALGKDRVKQLDDAKADYEKNVQDAKDAIEKLEGGAPAAAAGGAPAAPAAGGAPAAPAAGGAPAAAAGGAPAAPAAGGAEPSIVDLEGAVAAARTAHDDAYQRLLDLLAEPTTFPARLDALTAQVKAVEDQACDASADEDATYLAFVRVKDARAVLFDGVDGDDLAGPLMVQWDALTDAENALATASDKLKAAQSTLAKMQADLVALQKDGGTPWIEQHAGAPPEKPAAAAAPVAAAPAEAAPTAE